MPEVPESMAQASARARQQQKVEELCAASIRALTNEAHLHFRGGRLHRGARLLPPFGPHLHPSLERDDFASFRGASDAMALRLTLSDADLHRQLQPEAAIERSVFELLEQLRVESLVPEAWPGVRHNLSHRFARWAQSFVDMGLADSQRGILLFTLALTVRSRLTAESMDEHLSDMIETTRGALSSRIGQEVAALRRCRDDQRAYAEHARVMARTVADMLQENASDDEGERQQQERDADARLGFGLLLPIDGEGGEHLGLADSGVSRVLLDAPDGYRVFTRDYDRELHAGDLVRPALLAELRDKLDARIAAQGVNLHRLARQLKTLLALPQTDGWDGAQEEGRIDGRSLARLVASPTERRLFKQERSEPVADCLVTFLIDCSGSMKAQIETVATIVDVMARCLEMAGVQSEVLGYTTMAWNGGKARRDWLRAGSPMHPGRLNEVCHLIIKSAHTSWRRARRSMAAMLKADLFREGIDGEAVDWAVARMGNAQRRRILLVFGDGSPMDTATHLVNDAHYLDHHLRDVVQRHEASGQVEICGIGVGLDLSPYYARSQALDLSVAPGNRVFQEIMDAMTGHHRR